MKNITADDFLKYRDNLLLIDDCLEGKNTMKKYLYEVIRFLEDCAFDSVKQ